jgi:hypothetical protein
MPAKTTQLVKDDPVLKAFTLELRNLWDQRWEELGQNIRALVEQANREAVKFSQDNPGATRVVDVVFIRYRAHRVHAADLAKDFLNAFHGIIRPHCGFISDGMRVSILMLLNIRYGEAVERVGSHLKQLLASLGKDEQFKSSYPPLEGIYQREHHKCSNLLEAEIAKHNVEVGTKQARDSKGISQNRTHIPKHKVVKEGVNKMLKSLRLERPETTLDEAKHVYANQEGLSYANVNKAYHYKSKK